MHAARRRDFRVVVVTVEINNNNNNNCSNTWDRQHTHNGSIKTDNIRESKELMMVAKNQLAPNECFYAYYFIYSHKKLKR